MFKLHCVSSENITYPFPTLPLFLRLFLIVRLLLFFYVIVYLRSCLASVFSRFSEEILEWMYRAFHCLSQWFYKVRSNTATLRRLSVAVLCFTVLISRLFRNEKTVMAKPSLYPKSEYLFRGLVHFGTQVKECSTIFTSVLFRLLNSFIFSFSLILTVLITIIVNPVYIVYISLLVLSWISLYLMDIITKSSA